MKPIPFILLLMSLLFGSCQRVLVAPNYSFEKDKYVGLWYEIARLDHRFERNMIGVTAEYTLQSNGRIGVVNRGYNTKTKQWDEVHAYAKVGKAPNLLKVYFFWGIPGSYQVAYVNQDYTLALVSGGDLGHLWFLARKPQISPDEKHMLEEMSETLGYNIRKLIYVEQMNVPKR